jgi:hypothetical protein
MPRPPEEFAAMQISRLNEALLAAYSAMYNSITGANFKAINQAVRIVRELDRYHGVFPGHPALFPRRAAPGPGRGQGGRAARAPGGPLGIGDASV